MADNSYRANQDVIASARAIRSNPTHGPVTEALKTTSGQRRVNWRWSKRQLGCP
jgi:hypothetical protein